MPLNACPVLTPTLFAAVHTVGSWDHRGQTASYLIYTLNHGALHGRPAERVCVKGRQLCGGYYVRGWQLCSAPLLGRLGDPWSVLL